MPAQPDLTLRIAPETGARRRHCLVIDGDSSSFFALSSERPLVIGRDERADLRLSDPSVSRLHAQITPRGDALVLVDLGSRNGTRVNGERLQAERLLEDGDVVSLGAATLVVHDGAAKSPPVRLLDGPAFQRRLAEEVERGLRYGRTFSLLLIELCDRSPVDRAAIERAVGDALRAPELAALAPPSHLWVLLPETPGDRALGPARSLIEALAPGRPRAGLATHPADGCDASALIGSARSAARAAPVGGIASTAETCVGIPLGDDRLIVAGIVMSHLVVLLERLAGRDVPLLLCGEPGVGKRLLARAVHRWSPRRERRLVSLSAAPDLDLAVLVGSDDAGVTRPGLLDEAAGGTLLVEDVERLRPSAQLALLRLLERGHFTRVGGERPIEAQVRIVATSAADLRAEAAVGRLHPELLRELGTATVVIPSLRDRRREIALLAHGLLQWACARRGRPPRRLSGDCLRALAAHAWPGNISELRETVERLALWDGAGEIPASELPPHIRECRDGGARVPGAPRETRLGDTQCFGVS